ncbi:MAG: P-II family nitrogen regulator, partial [Treponema sp.]|nr:P-II family nitrogen regulator [Treponema sp.]
QLLPKEVVMIVLPTSEVDGLIEFLKKELYTGHIGDGKIFVSDITNIVRVRTGEEGMDALISGEK